MTDALNNPTPGDPFDVAQRHGRTCPICAEDRTPCCDLLPRALSAGKALMDILDGSYLSQPVRQALDAFQTVINAAMVEAQQGRIGGWDIGSSPDFITHTLTVVADEEDHGRIR